MILLFASNPRSCTSPLDSRHRTCHSLTSCYDRHNNGASDAVLDDVAFVRRWLTPFLWNPQGPDCEPILYENPVCSQIRPPSIDPAISLSSRWRTTVRSSSRAFSPHFRAPIVRHRDVQWICELRIFGRFFFLSLKLYLFSRLFALFFFTRTRNYINRTAFENSRKRLVPFSLSFVFFARKSHLARSHYNVTRVSYLLVICLILLKTFCSCEQNKLNIVSVEFLEYIT